MTWNKLNYFKSYTKTWFLSIIAESSFNPKRGTGSLSAKIMLKEGNRCLRMMSLICLVVTFRLGASGDEAVSPPLMS